MIFAFKIPYTVIFPSLLFKPINTNHDKNYVVNDIKVIRILDWLVELNPVITDAYVQDTFTTDDIPYITIAIIVEERIYARLLLTNPSLTIKLKIPREEEVLDFNFPFGNMERVE